MKWVKHDTDANQDAKLQNVLLDHGLEGYGLYWYCVELIANKVDNDNITFELEHDARIIARNVGSTEQKVNDMMTYFVNLGLFESNNNVITCLKLAKRLDKSMTSNPQMREIIGKLRSHDSIMTQSAKPMQDKIREEEIKLDKNITCDSRFNEFWDLYGKKVDTKKCKAKFDKLSKVNQDKIFEVLPDYISSTPDKQFRKLPMTWLNGECWNDEVQKPLTLTGECGINFDLLVENFNKSMMIWSGVPEVIKITEKQKDMVSILERDFAMTDERFEKYFEHIATSDKFKYFVDGINMPAQNLTFFLKEDTIQK